ncbi:MAG: 6-carboxytetrahydropterin synthase [Gemmatimonadetes bacterium]|jgi:6-pyruvoyltetrahydropterin/6-carboxytetrahydropterin synthase|nr:6-carboxytetrahydropterin synthase [Gemmatimonadota bacterium]MBT7864277.1 6-carboxytetrahydropterin synthase [Gemmatimonadota bacterium]
MEQIIAKGRFHAAHRQLGYEGKCAWVHGHTWRGTFTVRAEAFPRDDLDMSVDFGALKKIFKDLDHKMLVSEQDRTFLDAGLFEPEGVVIMPGSNPSVENVTHYCMNEAIDRLTSLFPGRGIDYDLEVMIQETDNNFFTLHRTVSI